MRKLLSILCFATCLVGGGVWADWREFRGPGGSASAPDKGLPRTWSNSENLLWKTELPGPGASSPIVVGQRIFITCYSGYGTGARDPGVIEKLQRHLVCLDRAGKIVWDRTVPAAMPEHPFASFQALHGFASSTPASDGQRVYVFFGRSGVLAFDLAGKQLWQTSVGTKTNSWGSGTSPILYKDLVIVNASIESNALVALRKQDGAQAWSATGIQLAWNTPVLVTPAGSKPELVVNTYTKLRAFDPESGNELWHCDGIDDYVCPSPAVHDGVVFVIGGRSYEGLAVRAGGKGDVSKTHVLWKVNKASNVSSPVYHDGHFYWAHDSRGEVYCVRAKDGTLVYQQKLTPAADRIYASPVVADGKLYYVSRTRGTYVLATGPEFKQLAHNVFDDPTEFDGTPAVSDGQILLRSKRYLYCIGKK